MEVLRQAIPVKLSGYWNLVVGSSSKPIFDDTREDHVQDEAPLQEIYHDRTSEGGICLYVQVTVGSIIWAHERYRTPSSET